MKSNPDLIQVIILFHIDINKRYSDLWIYSCHIKILTNINQISTLYNDLDL